VPDATAPGSDRDTLVLFTLGFPFGTGETFLENEMPYLVSRFRRVILVPATVSEHTRSTPPEVEVDVSIARPEDARFPASPADGLSAALSAAVWREIGTGPEHRLHPRGLLKMFSWHARGEKTRRWIEAAARAGRIQPSETVLYTFWLDPAALGIARSADTLPETLRVARAHRFDIYEDETRPPYLPFRIPTFEGLHAVYPDSDRGTQYLQERFPAFADQVETRYLGTTDPGMASRASGAGILRIVSCSYLKPVKRVGLLARAIAELANRRPDRTVEWVHMGDGPLRREIETFCQDNLAAPNVRWSLAGHRSNDDVLRHYRENEVDVFVNVSTSEGVPVSIMEAQSFGIPVVAPDAGGMREAVRPANGALLSANPTPGEVASGIEQVVAGDDEARQDVRRASRALWEQCFSAAINYDRFLDGLVALDRSPVSR
jgi:glycosyltransferase involved in cell wall biosynthesis